MILVVNEMKISKKLTEQKFVIKLFLSFNFVCLFVVCVCVCGEREGIEITWSDFIGDAF